MKKQILEAVKNKYRNLGFGEKAFEGVADFVSTSVTEVSQIETAIAGVEGLLKAFQADTDKLRTEKSAAEKKLAELAAKATGGEPNPIIEPNNQESESPSWAKKLHEANEALSRKVAAMEGEKISTNRKQQLSKLIEKLPENIRKPYARISVDTLTDEEFAATLSEVTTEVDGISADLLAKGTVFQRPIGGTGGVKKPEPSTNEVNELLSHIKL